MGTGLKYPLLHTQEGTNMTKVVTFKTLNTGGADKSLARTGRKQATATEDFDVHISFL